MPAWTPAERRGAALVVLLFCLGAARDLWRASHPRLAQVPGPAVVAAPAAADREPAGPARAASRPVDLNRAGMAELDALPGIGPVLAGRILGHRATHGPFREPEDLLDVPGIGPRLFERLRPLVCVRPPPNAVASPGVTLQPAAPLPAPGFPPAGR